MIDVKVTKDLDNKRLFIEFDIVAPKHEVWQKFATKEGFESWWGPEGWQTTTTDFNFVPDGRIHYGMTCTDPQQTDWFNKTSWGIMHIKSIDAETIFTYQDFFSDEDGALDTSLPALIVTNEFTEDNGTTHVTSTSLAENAQQIEQLLEMGMIEGFTSQLQRLEAQFSTNQ